MDTVCSMTAEEINALTADIARGTVEMSAAQARMLLDVEAGTEAAAALFAGAQKIRAERIGTNVHFCSILNAKSGGCSENCSYCSQASGVDGVDYDKYSWMDDEDIVTAADSAHENGANALGLVAAWKGVKEGRQLDMVCESLKTLTKNGEIRADVNLGLLDSQNTANRLQEAGVAVYGHNLETAKSFFDQTCSSHSFEERMQTIGYIKESGMGLCSGGIVGMGEDKDQRIEFAEQLRYIEPQMIPINFLNPLEGTGLEGKEPMDTDEALITLAVYRCFLPDRNIMVAGGKEVTFGDRLGEVFVTGINSVMVGNYLTTLGTAPDFWKQAVADAGLTVACGGDCGCK